MHPTLKRNFEVFSAADWLAALTAHIPNAGEHLVRVLRLVQSCQSRQAPEGPGRGAGDHRGIHRGLRLGRGARVGTADQADLRGGSAHVSPVYRTDADHRVHRATRSHREDIAPPGTPAHPHPQPAGRGTRCRIPCNGSHCRLVSWPWLRRGRAPGAVPPCPRSPPEPIRLATLSR
jgi:hypothetical protein